MEKEKNYFLSFENGKVEERETKKKEVDKEYYRRDRECKIV